MDNSFDTISDDVLDEIYLANKRIGEDMPLFTTSEDTFFTLDRDVTLVRPNDKNNTTFRMFTYEKRYWYEPSTEVEVNPNTTEITFSSVYEGVKTKRFQATFDSIERNWDVRSYMHGERVLSNLNNSLNEVLTIPYFAKEEYKGFLRIIEAAKKLSEKKKAKGLAK